MKIPESLKYSLFATGVVLMTHCTVSNDHDTDASENTVLVVPRISLDPVDSAWYNKAYSVYVGVVHYPQDTLFKQQRLFADHEVYIPVKVASGSKIQYWIMGLDSSDNAIWYGESEWVEVDGDTATIDLQTSVILQKIVEDSAQATDLMHYWYLSRTVSATSSQYFEVKNTQQLVFFADSTYSSLTWAVALRDSGNDTIFYAEESGDFHVTAQFSDNSGSVKLVPQQYSECRDSVDAGISYCGKDVWEQHTSSVPVDGIEFDDLFQFHADSMTLTQNGDLLEYRMRGATIAAESVTVDLRTDDTIPYISVNNMDWMSTNLDYQNSGIESWCYGDSTSCPDGRLYTWAAAKNACPVGWRLPTMDEWGALAILAGGSSDFELAGERLLAQSEGGNDFIGFHGRLGGYQGRDGLSHSKGEYGLYWTSDTQSDTMAIVANLTIPSETSAFGFGLLPPTAAAAVRCLRLN